MVSSCISSLSYCLLRLKTNRLDASRYNIGYCYRIGYNIYSSVDGFLVFIKNVDSKDSYIVL